MKKLTVVSGIIPLCAALMSPSAAKSLNAPSASSPPAVIATFEQGVNVLHEDFRLTTKTSLPAGLPPVERVQLPTAGSFEDRVAAARKGVLGHLVPGVLYYIEGTRLLIYTSADSRGSGDVLEVRGHGTGVAGAAVGIRHGTNPDAFLVLIADDLTLSAWRWVAEQDWIDAVSTSYIAIWASANQCPEAEYIQEIEDRGRLMFSGIGNGEQVGHVLSPSGVPSAYQVGGVDDEGRTYLPDPEDEYPYSTTDRPYETGDRLRFSSSDPDSLSGSSEFGGTSGATPSTAGRATELVQYARSILGSTWTGTRAGVLARISPGRQAPSRGPLRDGDLTNAELVRLLHNAAIPAEPPGPTRYLIEGYGALNEEAVALAKHVLAGKSKAPDRPDEDRAHEQVEAVRAAAYAERCG